MTTPPLFSLLDDSAARHPDKVAVEEGSVTDPAVGAITYGELARLSRLAADRLRRLGVRPGDRVGLYLRKSVDGVAAIFGALRAGAAYVPVDPGAPPARNAYILDDCSVRTVLVERRFAEALRAGLAARGPVPPLLVLDDVGGGHALRAALTREERPDPALPLLDHRPSPHDLAYILYTSGSTGKPKGVMLSHRNATSFVDWCSETFAVTAADRCSSHAPFHFDLS
ncbi:MAG TPA: AMP-binding protein, partial [Methylomirabilota bacterium]|nr:AMP-binding protein [Methylomirabilota bacterium]